MATPSRRALVPCRYIDRLPRGGDRSVGAGYAMAAAATAATLVWYALYTLLMLALAGVVGGRTSVTLLPFVAGGMVLYAVGTLLLVVPSAFFAGVLA